MTLNKFNTVQVLRFVAAFVVIIFHASLYTAQRLGLELPAFEQIAFNGVCLFFVISGFVMIISSKNLERENNGWKIFAMKRLVRIVPIYWLMTSYKLFAAIFASALVLKAGIDPLFILKSYFFIPALNSNGEFFPFYNVGWTLNFEMFFYLLFTLALALRVNPLIFLGIIFIPLSSLASYKTNDWPAFAFYFNPIVLNFLFGMLIAKLVQNNIKLPQNISAFLILICLLYLFLPKSGIVGMLLPYNSILTGLSLFLLVYAGVSIENRWGSRIPAWLVFLGAASYSLYLIHPSIAPLVPVGLKFLNLGTAWLSVGLAIILSIVAGCVFYKFCEEPITRFFTAIARKYKLL